MCKTFEISETVSKSKTLDREAYYLLLFVYLLFTKQSSYPEFLHVKYLLIFSVISLIITKHRGGLLQHLRREKTALWPFNHTSLGLSGLLLQADK